MASPAHVKTESLKHESEDMKDLALIPEDDEAYEDAGDMEIYDASLPQNPHGSMYLTHVPQYLYDQWVKIQERMTLGNMEQMQVGTIRQYNEVGRDGKETMKLALLVDSTKPELQNVPKEYELDIKDMHLKNTYMFTEQHMPGYKATPGQGANSNIPAHLRRQQAREAAQKLEGVGKAGGSGAMNAGIRKDRDKPYFRKAIPKKTALYGTFRHELRCQPKMNPETRHILATRARDALEPKYITPIVSRGNRGAGSIAETHAANKAFEGFVGNSAPAKAKAKKAKEKAARMDENALRDSIFGYFREHPYISMNAFQSRLRQPVVWLRQQLEELAVLHRTGRFANHWELKQEYKDASSASASGGQMAPEPAGEQMAPEPKSEDSEDSDDVEDFKMEDVM